MAHSGLFFNYFRESRSVDGPVLWFPFPLLASGDPQSKKALAIPCFGPALEQEACRVGLLRFLQNLNPYKLGTLRPRGGIEPLTRPHVPGFEVQSQPQPQSRRPTGTHKGGYQHATFAGAVVPEPCLGCLPKNSLGRCARKLWGPALEQEALAGMPPKKLPRTLRQEALRAQSWSRKPLQGCLPKNALGRCARKLWGPALEQEALAGMPPKKLSGTLR